MKDPIFITGLPRSGTSMTCAVLSSCGLDFGGPLAAANEHNAKGYFEHLEVRQKVLKPLLGLGRYDEKGQGPVPKNQLSKKLSFVLKASIDLALQSAAAYKDAKLYHFAAPLIEAYPNSRWVICLRDRDSFVASCLRTPFMNRYQTAESWGVWYDSQLLKLEYIPKNAAHTYVLHPNPEKVKTWRGLVDFCGLEWNHQKVKAALDPALWTQTPS